MWHGKWVLEVEDTREGREALLDALGGRAVGPSLRICAAGDDDRIRRKDAYDFM